MNLDKWLEIVKKKFPIEHKDLVLCILYFGNEATKEQKVEFFSELKTELDNAIKEKKSNE